jgi:hypothetical protein
MVSAPSRRVNRGRFATPLGGVEAAVALGDLPL